MDAVGEATPLVKQYLLAAPKNYFLWLTNDIGRGGNRIIPQIRPREPSQDYWVWSVYDQA